MDLMLSSRQSFWIVIDKPLGISSNAVLGKVKRLFKSKKAGFSGTLDPLASGVLPIAFGEALKTMHYMTFQEKAYTFQIHFGKATTTGDSEGEVTETSHKHPEKDEILAILPRFHGVTQQIPPIYSAIKIDGQRAYAMARRGEEIELKARSIRIDDLRLVSINDDDHATFEVACSAGTYVRSLARDIAEVLETKGHVSMLRRTRSGCFDLSHAISLEKLEEIVYSDAIRTYQYSTGIGLDDILAVPITFSMYEDLRQGRTVSFTIIPSPSQEVVGLWIGKSFAGFATWDEELLHPKRMINFDA